MAFPAIVYASVRDVDESETSHAQGCILVLPGFVPFDLGIPCEVFGRVQTRSGRQAYSVRVCTQKSEAGGDAFRLRSQWRLEHLAAADTVIIPGITNPLKPVPAEVIEAIRKA